MRRRCGSGQQSTRAGPPKAKPGPPLRLGYGAGAGGPSARCRASPLDSLGRVGLVESLLGQARTSHETSGGVVMAEVSLRALSQGLKSCYGACAADLERGI